MGSWTSKVWLGFCRSKVGVVLRHQSEGGVGDVVAALCVCVGGGSVAARSGRVLSSLHPPPEGRIDLVCQSLAWSSCCRGDDLLEIEPISLLDKDSRQWWRRPGP